MPKRSALRHQPAQTSLLIPVTNQSGAVTFPAPGATNDAQRFYRAVWE